MVPMDFRALKDAAQEKLEPWKKPSGWVAVCFFLLLSLLQFLVTYLSTHFIVLPEFTSAEALVQYFTNGHANILLLMIVFNACSLLLAFLFSGVFSAYCLRVARGSLPEHRTLLRSIKMLPRYLLLFVLLLAVLFLISLALSFLAITSMTLASLLITALSIGAIVLFYALRLCLFTVADRKDTRVIRALKDCASMTRGHKKELFLLDFSFLWYFLLLYLIPSLFALLPDVLAALASGIGSASLLSLMETNATLLSVLCSVLSALAILPLYYKYHTFVQLTYALAYQKLKEQAPEQTETQPLAYKEFDEPMQ